MTREIKVENLNLNYGTFPALKNISFRLPGGKIYGLLGRNGAGKTSLLSILAGFRLPSAGKVEIDGENPFEHPDLMSQIVFVRDKNMDEESEKVKKLLEDGEIFRPNWDKEFAAKLVNRFDLPLEKSASQLSRGMQSALKIVIGLASRSPVTIFDEAHMGMDAPSRYIFYEELLEDYMKHPRTVIISTHLIGEISSYLEEILILDRGSLIIQNKTEELLEKGYVLSGDGELIERFSEGLRVLEEKTLGQKKSKVVFGDFNEEFRNKVKSSGLEMEKVDLQDLFVHLTKKGEERK